MAKYFCVRLHALFGAALAFGLVLARMVNRSNHQTRTPKNKTAANTDVNGSTATRRRIRTQTEQRRNRLKDQRHSTATIKTEPQAIGSWHVRFYKILRGHKSSVQSVAAQTNGEMVCSGSWDCTINLWQINDTNAENDLVSKKRKVEGRIEDSQLEGEAFTTLVGHTQCVSSVIWPQRESIYSASWDHSIRKWDVEKGKNVTDIFCGKALNCLDIGGESSALIAAGGSDPVVRIWDPRKPGTSAPVFQFASHTSWVTTVKWHDKSSFHLLSASYDGKVMLWDLRTAWPLSTIESHSDKVLCADWWKSDSVISGGADSKLCISSQIPVQ